MNLLLPKDIVSRLVEALAQAGSREIGGVLMAEHVDVDTFRVKELTIQKKGGTFAAFVRFVEEIVAPLRSFFKVTNHDYRRFNYIGEWHSHHSFALSPSNPDHSTMIDLVMDRRLGAHFVVLLLVKLGSSGSLDCTVTVYRPHVKPYRGVTTQE